MLSCFYTPCPLHQEPEPGLFHVLFSVSLDIFSVLPGEGAGLCVWSGSPGAETLGESCLRNRSVLCWRIQSSKQNGECSSNHLSIFLENGGGQLALPSFFLRHGAFLNSPALETTPHGNKKSKSVNNVSLSLSID